MKQHAKKCLASEEIKMFGEENGSNCTCDGYHTFDELYDHRIALYIALCRVFQNQSNGTHEVIDGVATPRVWKTRTHSDGSTYDNWFVLGINYARGEQITYHLPILKWNECYFARELEKAPEFDGHTPDDVLERLFKL